MLSISAISMALINVFINDPTCNNFATAISVIFPILVLSISLIESSKDYSTIANKMLLCGQQLNTLISSIEYTKIEKLEDLQKINNDYNQIIKSFSEINHEDIDVYVTLCKNPSLSGQRDKINWFFRLKTWFFSNVWEYKTSWLSLLIAFTLSGLYLFFIN